MRAAVAIEEASGRIVVWHVELDDAGFSWELTRDGWGPARIRLTVEGVATGQEHAARPPSWAEPPAEVEARREIEA